MGQVTPKIQGVLYLDTCAALARTSDKINPYGTPRQMTTARALNAINPVLLSALWLLTATLWCLREKLQLRTCSSQLYDAFLPITSIMTGRPQHPQILSSTLVGWSLGHLDVVLVLIPVASSQTEMLASPVGQAIA